MKKIITFLLIFITYNGFAQTIDATEIELNFYGDSRPQNITKGITKIYFSANNGIDSEELWVHDMATNETRLVKDISSNASGIDNYSIFLTVDDILYFTASLNALGVELWRSDGTESGTYLIKDFGDFVGYNAITSLTYYNGNIFFAAYNNTVGSELWVSDGTSNGTVLFKDINIGELSSYPSNFFEFNGYLYFIAEDVTNGRELWKSDGTLTGTNLFKDISPGNNSGVLGNVIKMNSNFYFYAWDNGPNGYELWKSDGTTAGTTLFKDIIPGVISSNNKLYGAATNSYFIFEVVSNIGTELWKCDGTVAGTTLLKDIYLGSNSGVSTSTQFAILNDEIYFDARTATTGLELWRTDGTTIGTQLVKDIRTGINSSNITKLTATSNYLVFSAQGDTHNYKTLWKSDGTTNGTIELKNVNLTLYANDKMSFVELNNKVFFPGGYNSPNGIELWTTDGTTENTNLFKDISHQFSGMTDFYDVAELGNKLIYTGNNGNGNEPFITDGTISGTNIIKDINPGSGDSLGTSVNFRPASYTKAGNYVFFRACLAGYGCEIWKTDGTQANTSMVKDIKVGNSSSISEYPLFMEFNGIFYFKADDGIHGEELWRSDGTDSGTYMLKDINPGSGFAFGGQSNIFQNSDTTLNEKCYAVLNGYLYFAAFDGTDHSIWRTDGTTSGTIKVIIIPSSGVYDNKRVVINANNNKIFFKTNTSNSSFSNHSLWSSDGTQAGTNLLFVAGSSFATQFKKNIVHNNNLYFTAYGIDGNKLMKSDGTVAGTTAVIDNFTTQNTFNSLTSCGNYVYFGVGPQGLWASEELWRTNGSTSSTIKLGDVTSSLEYFVDCKTCIQGNLFFKKRFNEDKIYYVNGTSFNADSYLTTNLVNSQNFGEIGYFSYSDFYNLNGKLLFTASKQYAGTELYSSEFNFSSLANENFNEIYRDKIVIYPNPAKNFINFQTQNGETILKASIYNLLGEMIFSSKISNNQLELSSIDDGIFIVNIITDKSQYNSKIIVKK